MRWLLIMTMLSAGCVRTRITHFDARTKRVEACGNQWANWDHLRERAVEFCQARVNTLNCGTEQIGSFTHAQARTSSSGRTTQGFAVETPVYGSCCLFQCGRPKVESESL